MTTAVTDPATTPDARANKGRRLLYVLAACSATLIVTVVALAQDVVSHSRLVPTLGMLAALSMIGDLVLAPMAVYRLLRNPSLRSALNWIVVAMGLLGAAACLFLVIAILT
jgi:hypothetical protein